MYEPLKEYLVKEIFTKSAEVEAKQKQIEQLEKEIEELTVTIEDDKLNLLNHMKEEKQEVFEEDDLVAQFFAKNEFSYGDEKALLKKLQDMNLTQYVKVTTKTTTSIDKNNLKKDLKVNAELKESLKDFVSDRVTEYVVVTTKENHQKMLEHIEEGKKK